MNKQKFIKGLPAILVASALSSVSWSALAADYYVDPVNGNDGNPGTQAAPFKDFWAMNAVLKPGDTGHMGAGLYTQSLWITASGTPGAPVTIVSDVPQAARIATTASTMAVMFAQGTAYVRFSGFDVTGSGSDGNVSGIWVLPGAHHITIDHNIVHDCSAAGIGTYQGDYLTIVGNVVRGNAHTGNQDASGIDLYQLTNIDNDTSSIHNVVASNIVWGNANYVPTPPATVTTDGNGIIVDDSRHTQNGDTAPPYQGETLIENNLVVDNGGRGVHVYQSDDVFVTNNTIAYNNQVDEVYRPGEVMAIDSGNVKVYNNILTPSARPRHYGFSTVSVSGQDIVADYNLIGGGVGAVYLDRTSAAGQSWGANNVIGSALFVAPSTKFWTADYRLNSASPAFGMGARKYGSAVDITGQSRQGAITVGAYQSPTG